MASSTQVHNGRAEGLDERRARVGETHDATPVTQSLVEGSTQNEPCVLNGVMIVHPYIALRFYREIDARMVGEQVQKVVQKPHSGLDLSPTLAVYFYFDLYIGLGCLALRTTLTRHLPPASLE